MSQTAVRATGLQVLSFSSCGCGIENCCRQQGTVQVEWTARISPRMPGFHQAFFIQPDEALALAEALIRAVQATDAVIPPPPDWFPKEE